jgi:hypothetical protein
MLGQLAANFLFLVKTRGSYLVELILLAGSMKRHDHGIACLAEAVVYRVLKEGAEFPVEDSYRRHFHVTFLFAPIRITLSPFLMMSKDQV